MVQDRQQKLVKVAVQSRSQGEMELVVQVKQPQQVSRIQLEQGREKDRYYFSLLRRQLLIITPWASFVAVNLAAQRLLLLPYLYSFTQETQETEKIIVVPAEEASIIYGVRNKKRS